MPPSRPLVLTEHARTQARRRDLSEDLVLRVARSPEQRVRLRLGREIRQSRIASPDGKLYLVRVVVDSRIGQDDIVTVYRTSKIGKYWSAP